MCVKNSYIKYSKFSVSILSSFYIVLLAQFAHADDHTKPTNTPQLAASSSTSTSPTQQQLNVSSHKFSEDEIQTIIKNFDINKAAKNEVSKELLVTIGVSPASMYNFLQRYPAYESMATYTDIATANSSIKSVMEANVEKIINWLNNDVKRRLVIKKDFDTPVGYGVTKNNPEKKARKKAIVILLKDDSGDNFNIIASYPVK